MKIEITTFTLLSLQSFLLAGMIATKSSKLIRELHSDHSTYVSVIQDNVLLCVLSKFVKDVKLRHEYSTIKGWNLERYSEKTTDSDSDLDNSRFRKREKPILPSAKPPLPGNDPKQNLYALADFYLPYTKLDITFSELVASYGLLNTLKYLVEVKKNLNTSSLLDHALYWCSEETIGYLLDHHQKNKFPVNPDILYHATKELTRAWSRHEPRDQETRARAVRFILKNFKVNIEINKTYVTTKLTGCGIVEYGPCTPLCRAIINDLYPTAEILAKVSELNTEPNNPLFYCVLSNPIRTNKFSKELIAAGASIEMANKQAKREDDNQLVLKVLDAIKNEKK